MNRTARWLGVGIASSVTWLASLLVLLCCAANAQQSQPGQTASPTILRSQSAAFRAALERIAPALVRIETIGGAMPVEQIITPEGETVAASGFRQADGPTTGLICTPDGYILTSSFNFARDPTVITVALPDGRRFVARLVARDRQARLALLKIEAAGLTVPEWAPLEQVRVGQWALLAGYGHGGNAPALSTGIIGALSRLDGRALQTDVRASPANYGGPLFDLDGRVIGVCVPRAGRGEDEVAGVEWYDSGIGFAIRNDYIAHVLPTLRAGRDFDQGYLGLRVDPADRVVYEKPETAPRSGVRVMEIVIGGPAAAAGLSPGDLITSIDQQPILRRVEFTRAVARLPAGQQVSITFSRDGAEQTCSATLANAAELQAMARAARTSQPTTDSTAPREQP